MNHFRMVSLWVGALFVWGCAPSTVPQTPQTQSPPTGSPAPDGADAGTAPAPLEPAPAPAPAPSETIDADGDGIADALEDSLLRTFAPHVRLHPADWTRPSSVEWYLERSELWFGHHLCGDHLVLPARGNSQRALLSQVHPLDSLLCRHRPVFRAAIDDEPSFYLHPASEETRAGQSALTGWLVYAHAFASPAVKGAVTLQYWFFYPYDFAVGSVDHEGDWEHVSITVRPEGRFLFAYYGQHFGGETLTTEKLTFVGGTHPVAYSAIGTHATYATPGSHAYATALVRDETAEGGPEWKTEDNLINLGERGHPLNGQVFLFYGGRWGKPGLFSFTSGPIGPGFKRAWDEDNGEGTGT